MKYVIWSAEHNLWWKPNWDGYTPHLWDAGRYEKAEAEKIVREANIPFHTQDTGSAFKYVHEVMIPEPFTVEENSALLEAGLHYLKRWPNEENTPVLRAAVDKLGPS